MYESERLLNFRWIAKLCATHSSYTLSSQDIVPLGVHLELAALGQFAEIAYGIVDPGFGAFLRCRGPHPELLPLLIFISV